VAREPTAPTILGLLTGIKITRKPRASCSRIRRRRDRSCRIRAEILPPRRLLPSSEPVRRPVYKTAALPAELHRRVTRCIVAQPRADKPIPPVTCTSELPQTPRLQAAGRPRLHVGVRLTPAVGGSQRPSVPNTCQSFPARNPAECPPGQPDARSRAGRCGARWADRLGCGRTVPWRPGMPSGRAATCARPAGHFAAAQAGPPTAQ
jgi:hypothetical protein